MDCLKFIEVIKKLLILHKFLVMKSILILFISIFGGTIFAQNVGIGTSTPNLNAKLDVESNNSGLLPTRLTTVQRNAIVSPPEGLLIYNTTTKCIEY